MYQPTKVRSCAAHDIEQGPPYVQLASFYRQEHPAVKKLTISTIKTFNCVHC